ncbi:MAG: L-threonylcarbamoyladenylate synthase [Acidobacteriota bacterium]
MTDRLPATAEGLAAATALLQGGALVAFPTDTLYGLACRAGDEEALARIFAAKRRPTDKLVPMLAASLEQAEAQGYLVDERARVVARRWWPGPLTLVLAPARPGRSTQGFRVPDHPIALELIRRSGPLPTSSANRSGEPEAFDADDVLVAFADVDLVAAVIDGGRVRGGVASTVVDLSVTPAIVRRDGPVTREQLAELIGLVD